MLVIWPEMTTALPAILSTEWQTETQRQVANNVSDTLWDILAGLSMLGLPSAVYL